MIAAVVVIGSCRAGALNSAPQRRPPSATESVEPSETHFSASPVQPEYQPPEPMVWMDVPLPYSPDAVVVRPVVDRYQVVFFPDEAAAVRRSVAKELQRLGYEVVPIPELERIESAAARGRLTLEDERECQVPLTPSEVRARYFDSFPQAHVYAECTVMPDSQPTDAPECRLSVLVGRDGVFPQFVSAPIRDVHDPEAWTRAPLSREGESVPGGVPWGVEGTPAVGLIVSRVIAVGPWKRSPGGRTADALGEGGSRCLHPDPRMSLHWQVSAAIDKRGAVERCTARSSGLGARAEDGDCLCQQLEAVNLGRGRPGRRLRASAWDPGLTSIRWRRLEPIQPGTRAWIRRISESPEVLACMHGAHEKQGRWSGGVHVVTQTESKEFVMNRRRAGVTLVVGVLVWALGVRFGAAPSRAAERRRAAGHLVHAGTDEVAQSRRWL
ncbi:MAG: hypothetical protein ACRBN8_33020 [Nannocystales bacterium]